MKRISVSAALAVVCATSLLASVSHSTTFQPKVIYGEDNRVDVYKESRVDLRDLADSTVGMIPNSLLKKSGKDVLVNGDIFGESNGLCKDEPFYDQPTAANCSGSLIGDDIVITAGHCITSANDCKKNSFVFNYRMQDEKNAPNSVSEDDVFACKKIIAREQTLQQDYAIIQLDRPVKGHRVLTMSHTPAAVGDELVVIGHPTGLPTKIAGGATVRSNQKGYFIANLDTYGGNSGSAVFNAKTNEIVGILVRGEQDFAYDRAGQCNRSNVCPATGCRGEDVTNIDFVLKSLNM